VQPPKKAGEGNGEAPVKVCDECAELCPISAKQCPACGYEFPPPAPKSLTLRDDDIMGLEPIEMPVRAWSWRIHVSRTSQKKMLAVKYYGRDLGAFVLEYLPLTHEGSAGDKAMRTFMTMLSSAGMSPKDLETNNGAEGWLNDALVLKLNAAKPPKLVKYRQDGKFYRVLTRSWNEQEAA
jgi:DNA repair protein RadD